MPSLPSLSSVANRARAAWSPLHRRVSAVVVIQVAGQGLGYVVTLLLTQWLAPPQYGAYVYAMSWASFMATFGTLGLSQAVVRFVPAYVQQRAWGRLRGFLRTCRGLTLASAAGLAAVGSAVVLLARPVEASLRLPLVAGLWLAPLLGLGAVEVEVLRARKRLALAYAPAHLLRPLLLVGGLGVVMGLAPGLLGASAGAPLVVLGVQAGAVCAAWAMQHAGARRALPRAMRRVAAVVTPGTWLRVALPLLAARGFLVAISRTDVFVLGAMEGSAAVGTYDVAVRVARVVTLVGFAVDAIAAPLVAERFHGGDDDSASLQRLATRLAHAYVWPTLALGAVLALLSHPLLGLFGPAYRSGQPVLFVYLLVFLANAATGVQTYLLTMTGHERRCVRVFGWSALLNVGLSVAGVWAFGALGAALASLATTILWNAWLRVLVARHVGVRPTIVDALLDAARRHVRR